MRKRTASKINKAAKAMQINVLAALSDPYRPKYHFLPPANWMNDPNGTIYYRGEYHLFYQQNPYKPTWGKMQWGHAKSKDLVHWEDLPMAIVPEGFPSEIQCWSGCCVIASDGTPTIFYTSMNSLALLSKAERFSQQWMATSDSEMLVWEKSSQNPILSERKNHIVKKPRQWRDPYVWRENDAWYMVLGGNQSGEKYGSIFLYKSLDLSDWEYLGILAHDQAIPCKSWECPNYIRLQDKYILIVSPFTQVMYSIGEFRKNKHISSRWFVFDHSKNFCATNTYFDDNGRVIVVGWIKVKGKSGWAGCLSLPRVLNLDDQNQLLIQPIKELEELRGEHIRFKDEIVSSKGLFEGKPHYGDCVEIKAKYNMQLPGKIGFKLVDDKGEYFISYNFNSNIFQAVNESAQLQFPGKPDQFELHIFIDKSVIEIFINNREVFSATIYPILTESSPLKVIPFFERTKGKAIIDFWRLDNIDQGKYTI